MGMIYKMRLSAAIVVRRVEKITIGYETLKLNFWFEV